MLKLGGLLDMPVEWWMAVQHILFNSPGEAPCQPATLGEARWNLRYLKYLRQKFLVSIERDGVQPFNQPSVFRFLLQLRWPYPTKEPKPFLTTTTCMVMRTIWQAWSSHSSPRSNIDAFDFESCLLGLLKCMESPYITLIFDSCLPPNKT